MFPQFQKRILPRDGPLPPSTKRSCFDSSLRERGSFFPKTVTPPPNRIDNGKGCSSVSQCFPFQNLLPVSGSLQTTCRRRLSPVELGSYFSKKVTPPANGSDDAGGTGMDLTRMVRLYLYELNLFSTAVQQTQYS
jgi:hypothetical protein